MALEVLGCCLCGGSIDKWEAALDGFKSKKIQDVLKISYNALDHSVQEVFLDIACFFKGVGIFTFLWHLLILIKALYMIRVKILHLLKNEGPNARNINGFYNFFLLFLIWALYL